MSLCGHMMLRLKSQQIIVASATPTNSEQFYSAIESNEFLLHLTIHNPIERSYTWTMNCSNEFNWSHINSKTISIAGIHISNGLFAFRIYLNARTSISSFKLQYGVKSKLPTAEAWGLTIRLAKAIIIDDHQRIKNLWKFETVAVECYHAAI